MRRHIEWPGLAITIFFFLPRGLLDRASLAVEVLQENYASTIYAAGMSPERIWYVGITGAITRPVSYRPAVSRLQSGYFKSVKGVRYPVFDEDLVVYSNVRRPAFGLAFDTRALRSYQPRAGPDGYDSV